MHGLVAGDGPAVRVRGEGLKYFDSLTPMPASVSEWKIARSSGRQVHRAVADGALQRREVPALREFLQEHLVSLGQAYKPFVGLVTLRGVAKRDDCDGATQNKSECPKTDEVEERGLHVLIVPESP